jgi:hypothetical protein
VFSAAAHHGAADGDFDWHWPANKFAWTRLSQCGDKHIFFYFIIFFC